MEMATFKKPKPLLMPKPTATTTVNKLRSKDRASFSRSPDFCAVACIIDACNFSVPYTTLTAIQSDGATANGLHGHHCPCRFRCFDKRTDTTNKTDPHVSVGRPVMYHRQRNSGQERQKQQGSNRDQNSNGEHQNEECNDTFICHGARSTGIAQNKPDRIEGCQEYFAALARHAGGKRRCYPRMPTTREIAQVHVGGLWNKKGASERGGWANRVAMCRKKNISDALRSTTLRLINGLLGALLIEDG